jgi:hypothetical protein
MPGGKESKTDMPESLPSASNQPYLHPYLRPVIKIGFIAHDINVGINVSHVPGDYDLLPINRQQLRLDKARARIHISGNLLRAHSGAR